MEKVLFWLKEQKIICLIAFLSFMCLVFIGLYIKEVTAEEAYVCPKSAETVDNEVNDDKIVVDIKGAVANPGVYYTDPSSIVNDIIFLAGGLTSDADTSNLNLSKKVTDEMVITVYTHEEVKNLEKQEAIIETDNSNDNDIEENLSGLININTASLEELQNLPGIGEAKAKSIIEYRKNCGKFTKKEDLLNIKGIGDSVFADLKDYITVE